MTDYEKYITLFNMLHINFDKCEKVLPLCKIITILVDGVYVSQFIFDMQGKLLELNFIN